jgi:signal transduction histidine kinase/HPt (histidine-containing phosphotransfer) domain-containing protein
MKPDKHLFAAPGIALAAAGLIALTWFGTTGAIHAQRVENSARVNATLANQALTFTEQINRQILGVDQTLRFLVTAWENNPRHFELEAWRDQAVVLNGLSRDMVLTDEHGIIRQSSVAEAINQNAAGLDYFRVLSDPSDRGDRMYIGPATIDGIMRQWHMNVARSLHYPDGSFAGVIDADYRIAAITDAFSQTDLGPGAFAAIAGLEDGKLRGAVGPSTVDPDASVGGTPMFAAVAAAGSGLWIGPSANDAVLRIHAFRHIPGRKLAVIVAMNEDEAMRPASVWRQQAQIFAACITALVLGMALILIQGTRLARRREAVVAEDRAVLAAANAQLEVARAFAAAKAEQLEATLAGMSDGVSMVDGHMCLVEWNARFPETAGVPAEILRVGLPMEEMLRAQIGNGQFGWIEDHEAEVERRMRVLRVAPYGVAQRRRPDGHTIELRRNRLPDGGFVTLYADITEHKRAEDALRAARAAAESANAEKSRIVAIVSHEIRTPLNALLNTVRLLAGSVLTPAQQSLLTTARRSGEMLFGLISDILVMSQMEAGKLTIRPSLFELRPLLDSCVEMFATQAAERGMTFHVAIADGTPETLLTDPGRLRQVQLNLLSNALKYARPGEVWLTAEPGRDAHEAVRLTVGDDGPVIAPDARERLFRPFSQLDRPEGDDQIGTGLGLSICRQLTGLMGGSIGCDARADEDGRAGNVFWMTLPATALPFRSVPGTGMGPGITGIWPDSSQPSPLADPAIALDEPFRRSLPRTCILLTEDVVANQLVIATLLRRQGHHVDIAASGPAAIQAVRGTPYDLIFMDIFMPGMGGQEATQIIRSLPEPACSAPIVALTANAGPGDEAIFKAAGMDGMLGKPVSLSELVDVIGTHVWSARPGGGSFGKQRVVPAVREPDGFAPVLSADRLHELRDNLPPEKFAELLEECLTDMDRRLPALRRALMAGTPGAITAHAHAMVGMAASYGMAALEVRLRAILTAARQGDMIPPGSSVIGELEAGFAEAARQLREIPRREVV